MSGQNTPPQRLCCIQEARETTREYTEECQASHRQLHPTPSLGPQKPIIIHGYKKQSSCYIISHTFWSTENYDDIQENNKGKNVIT